MDVTTHLVHHNDITLIAKILSAYIDPKSNYHNEGLFIKNKSALLKSFFKVTIPSQQSITNDIEIDCSFRLLNILYKQYSSDDEISLTNSYVTLVFSKIKLSIKMQELFEGFLTDYFSIFENNENQKQFIFSALDEIKAINNATMLKFKVYKQIYKSLWNLEGFFSKKVKKSR